MRHWRSRIGTCGDLRGFTSRLRLDVAANLAPAFDIDLAVADRPRDPAGRFDQEPVADGKIAFEAAAYFGLVDRRRAVKPNLKPISHLNAVSQMYREPEEYARSRSLLAYKTSSAASGLPSLRRKVASCW